MDAPELNFDNIGEFKEAFASSAFTSLPSRLMVGDVSYTYNKSSTYPLSDIQDHLVMPRLSGDFGFQIFQELHPERDEMKHNPASVCCSPDQHADTNRLQLQWVYTQGEDHPNPG